MNCPHCGAPIDDNMTVCEICQEAVNTPADVEAEEAAVTTKAAPKAEKRAPLSNRMWIWIGAVLVIAVAAVVFFMLQGKTPSGDADSKVVIARVNGEAIYKGDFRPQFAQMASLYAQFGMDITDPAQLQTMRAQIIDGMVQQIVIKQQAKVQGIVVPEEDKQAILAQFEADLESYRANFRAGAEQEKEQNPAIDVEKRTEELLNEALKSQGLEVDQLRQDALDTRMTDLLREKVEAQVTVEDADIQAWYDTNLPLQQQANTENPAQYGRDVAAGKPALFIPEGYTRVKHILIKPAEEYPTQALTEKETERSAWADEYKTLLLAGPGNEAARADLEKKVNDSLNESQALKDNWYNSVKAKADEALAKVKSGADFDALIAEYGEDPGMQVEPDMTLGYLFSKDSNFVEPFKEAALALRNVGDTSELVPSEFGYHIIKLVGAVKSEAVPMSEVRELIIRTLTAEKATELWEASVAEWTKASRIETFSERVADVTP